MKLLCYIALLLPLLCHAEITPPKGKFDPRVRVVDYNPLDVIRLSTFYGVSTHVQFAEGEKIVDTAVGDDQAWTVVDRNNHLYIKPKATKADTNVTVVTSKRTYQFSLVVQPRPIKDSTAWSDPNLIYTLIFNYPDEVAAHRAAAQAAIEQQANQKLAANDIKNRLKEAQAANTNTDYWMAGSPEISPSVARDDGRFIYLEFNNNTDMPAIYSVDAAGNEALINTNVIDGNTIVIQRLVPSLILRKGKYVVSVINKSFDLKNGKNNNTGTVSAAVERVIKGIEQ